MGDSRFNYSKILWHQAWGSRGGLFLFPRNQMIPDACGFIGTVTTCTELLIEVVLGKKDSPLQEVLYVLGLSTKAPKYTYILRTFLTLCTLQTSWYCQERNHHCQSHVDTSYRYIKPHSMPVYQYIHILTHTHTHAHANIHTTSWLVKGGAVTSCSTRACNAEVPLLDSKVKGVEGFRPR